MTNPMDDFIISLIKEKKELEGKAANPDEKEQQQKESVVNEELGAQAIETQNDSKDVSWEVQKEMVTWIQVDTTVWQENKQEKENENVQNISNEQQNQEQWNDWQQNESNKESAEDKLKELDSVIDALLNEATKSKEEKKEDVNTNNIIKSETQEEINQTLDKVDISVEEKEQIINYIDELETELAQKEFQARSITIERDEYKRLYEQERAKTNQMFDQVKELEWEQKKIKSSVIPEDVKNLVDYYRLMKENDTLYNRRNFIWELAKLWEQTTDLSLDSYIMDWLQKWEQFNKEEPSATPSVKEKWNANSSINWAEGLVKAIAF